MMNWHLELHGKQKNPESPSRNNGQTVSQIHTPLFDVISYATNLEWSVDIG